MLEETVRVYIFNKVPHYPDQLKPAMYQSSTT